MLVNYINYNSLDSVKKNELLNEFDYRNLDELTHSEFVCYIQRPSYHSN